jgi:GNAT superfamily N-acetyltransferase
MQLSSEMMSSQRRGPPTTGCCLDTAASIRNVSDAVEIRVAETRADLEKIYRFRYLIYVEEMGRMQRYADHARRRIQDPLDEGGVNLAAFRGEEVVGVVRINCPRDSDVGDYERFYHLSSVGQDHPAHTSITTRLMISPEYRRGRLAVRLAMAIYEYGTVRGIRWSFIDCNAHLIPFFRGLGYVEHIPPADHPEYGSVTLMRLDGLDRGHLEAVRSPFCRCLARHMNGRLMHDNGKRCAS